MTMGSKPGEFNGLRNTDTAAARARSLEVRRANALERKIQIAQALLIEHGYEVTPPTKIQ